MYVYQILNKKNGKKYIGQTIDKDAREYQHFLDLKNNTHDNSYLQASYNKYGAENFIFSVIDDTACNEEDLNKLEEYYILKAGFPDRNKCYNLQLPNGIPSRTYNIYKKQQENICKDYLTNMTVNELSKKYNISLQLLYKILKNNNINIGEKRRRLDLYNQVDNIIKDFTLNKLTASNIGKKYNTSSTMILKILRKNGVDVNKYKNSRSSIWKKEDEICRSYIESKSLQKVAKEYNVSATTIRQILIENDVKIQDGKRKDINEDEVCDLYNKGLSSRKIAKKYNCSKSTILNIIRRNNIQPHKNTTKFKKGNTPHNKGKTIIDNKGGVEYLYNNPINIVKNSTIKSYLSKKGVGVEEFFNLSFAQTSLVDFHNEVCLCLNTKGCKNNCLYCFNKKLKIGKPLSFDVAKLAIDKNIKYITSISLTGGEPLLNNDLPKIINYANKNGLKTKIDTSLNGNINNIPKNIDLINISLKNYSYVLSILDSIDYLIKNNYNCEFNLVYHKDYISKEECIKINEIISNYNIPLVFVEMDTSYCDLKGSCSKEELIDISTLFTTKEKYIQTIEYGREKVIL